MKEIDQKEKIKKKIDSDLDYIYSPRHNNSLKKILTKYPAGCPDKVIAQVLLLDSEDQVEKIYQNIIKKLQSKLL